MTVLNGFETSILIFVPIDVSDVPQIHQLRTARKNNYLAKIDPSIEKQYEYFNEYRKKNDALTEVYLKIIDKKKNETCGFVRVTNINNDYSLGWESLILKEGASAPIGIEICFTLYYLTFDCLKRSLLGPWIVTKDNVHMMRIHDHMGFVSKIDESDSSAILIVTRSNYESRKSKFLKWGFANEFHQN
jgi:hypothetical protein